MFIFDNLFKIFCLKNYILIDSVYNLLFKFKNLQRTHNKIQKTND